MPLRTPLLLILWSQLALAASPSRGTNPFEKCLKDVQDHPLAASTAKCFTNAGRKHGQLAGAFQHLKEQSRHLESPHWFSYNLAAVEYELGNLRSAAAYYRIAAQQLRDRKEYKFAVHSMRSAILMHIRTESFEDAEVDLRELAEIADESQNDQYRGLAKTTRAETYLHKGKNLAGARLLLLEAEELDKDGDDLEAHTSLLKARADVSHELAYYREARNHSEKLARIRREKKHPALGWVLYDLVITLVELEPSNRQGVQDLLQEALPWTEATPEWVDDALVKRFLGRQLRGAIGKRYLEECVRTAERFAAEDPFYLGVCLGSLAVMEAEDRPAYADELMARALEIAGAVDSPAQKVMIFLDRIRVAWLTRTSEEAMRQSLEVVDTIEVLRNLQESEIGRVGIFSAWSNAFRFISGQILRSNPSRQNLELSFLLGERMRGRTLLDDVEGPGWRTLLQSGSPLIQERASLMTELVDLQGQLLQNPSTRERRELTRKLEIVRIKEEEARTRISKASRDARVLQETDFAQLPEIVASLGPDQALLDFRIASDKNVFGEFQGGCWLILVTGEGARVFPLPSRSRLELTVKAFVDSLEKERETASHATSLYRDLLEVALGSLPERIDKLIVIPDGLLHHLPFSALKSSQGTGRLLDRFQIYRIPSATLWSRWRKQDPIPASESLVLANPTPPPSASKHLYLAGVRLELTDLPDAEREGRAVSSTLGGELRIGRAASESFLRNADLSSVGLLYFATHAVAEKDRRGDSAVVLYPGSADEDGLLQPHEIIELELSGRVVVLSSCQSASGAVVSGEGVMSLARAFFKAGARVVVGSLWRLRDDHAKELFVRFSDHLSRGKSVSMALTEAQRELRKAGVAESAWAGVVVIGDGDFIPFPGGTHGLAFLSWGPPAALLAALLLIFLRRFLRG